MILNWFTLDVLSRHTAKCRFHNIWCLCYPATGWEHMHGIVSAKISLTHGCFIRSSLWTDEKAWKTQTSWHSQNRNVEYISNCLVELSGSNMNTMMFEGFKLFTITCREIGEVADIQITSQWAPHLSVWSLGPLTSMAVCNQSVQVVNIRPIKNTLDRIRVVYYYKQLISRMDIPNW